MGRPAYKIKMQSDVQEIFAFRKNKSMIFLAEH